MLKQHYFDRDASRAFVSGNFTGKSASLVSLVIDLDDHELMLVL
jgi:hypothetical protein